MPSSLDGASHQLARLQHKLLLCTNCSIMQCFNYDAKLVPLIPEVPGSVAAADNDWCTDSNCRHHYANQSRNNNENYSYCWNWDVYKLCRCECFAREALVVREVLNCWCWSNWLCRANKYFKLYQIMEVLVPTWTTWSTFLIWVGTTYNQTSIKPMPETD